MYPTCLLVHMPKPETQHIIQWKEHGLQGQTVLTSPSFTSWNIWVNHLTSLSLSVHVCIVAQSCPTLCNAMDYIAFQAPLSIRFFRQEHWSGLPFPPPGDLLDPGFEPVSPASPALQADCFTAESSGKPRASVHSSTKWSHNKLVRLCWGFKKTPLFSFSRRLTLPPMRTNNSYPIGALITLYHIISPTIV